MSTELYSPRSYNPATRVYGSTLSCSSSEASSRLAARLERSEYKRSRAKQRVSSSSRNHSRRKDSRTSRKKNSSTRETLTKSEGDGVTSVWEVYRQNPYYYSDRVPEGSSEKREHRNTWYGKPNSTGSQLSERRPQSIHIGSSEYTNHEYQPWLSRKQTERNVFDHSLNGNNFEGSNEADTNYRTSFSPSYKDRQDFTEIQADFSLDRKGMYISRSLSSSFSSYVGSSDEKEDSQGIYSAYDVASRSPYESMVSRRYSQSSLSSSNASWHQHQGPTHAYNVRDIPPLLDPLTSKHHEKSHTRKSSSNYREIQGEFQAIKESVPPAVLPKPGKFSSSYNIQLHASKPKESPNWGPKTNRVNLNTSKGVDQTDNKGATVREIARKFTPASVRHISSVCNSQEEDRIIKAEISPSLEKSYNESSPPRGTDDKNKGVVMRQKEPSNKTPEELASHRLSLQELIQLHEEQIAIQAKSAKTNLTHVYLKRSPDVSPSRSTAFDGKVNKITPQNENAKVPVGNSEIMRDLQDDDNQKSTSEAQDKHGDYEVREVVVSQSSPFKVIELTDKVSNTPKGRASRLKRHRTIGIVGYRHQIDRTSEEKVETKLKRHTTVGIVSDFTDSSELLTKAKELLQTEDQNVSSLRNADINRISPVDNTIKQDNSKKPFPVKIFDIESNLDHENIQDTIPSKEMVTEQPIQSISSERWYSKALPDKNFLEWDNENKFSAVNNEYSEKASGTTSSITLRETQQDMVPSRSISTDKYQTTIDDSPSRNSQSPIVELLPEREGNPTAYYKSNTNYIHSHSKDVHLDTINHRHHLNPPKSHLVPVAQVSPVSHSFGSQEVDEHKSMPLASPPPEPPSAHEMYQTRLALWDLLPHKGKSNSDLSEHQSNESHFSVGEHSKPSSHSVEKLPAVKYIGQTHDRKPEPQQSRLSLNFERLDKTEEYYIGVIDTLKAENQRLKEKNESEKREFKRMYEEQKKVANAYQKLEDRYRRRVHELQDALASCTCQGSLIAKENDLKSSHLNQRREKESHTSKLQSGKSGMRMFEELEEWLSEQSKNSKAPKVNGTSRDSLISSSSDLTGTGWDDHCDMLDGDIDEVNGTHV